MTEQYKYYAFISYKREDEKWAKWLQHKLEYYRIPMAVRKQNPNLPERVRPIFKDTTDLSGGVLEKAINEALGQSQYLIVICSPRAAKSPWVCKEVQRFIDLGKEENIIPFIVDGTPFSNDATECFPTALKTLSGERELLGININENGQDSAAVKVVARMFNISFDILWQRFRRAENRRRKMIVVSTLIFILCLISISGYIIYKNIELQEKNETIQHQNEQIINTNWKMKETLARAVSSKAIELAEEGNSYMASLLAISVLPPKLGEQTFPYTAEAEKALRAATRSENDVLRGHTGDVQFASFSPDGQYVVSGGEDNTIVVWDVLTGKPLHKIKGHAEKVTTCFFSRNGDKIISSSYDGTIRQWNPKTGEPIGQIMKLQTEDLTTDWIGSAMYSYDGKRIVSAGYKSICIWDVKSNRIIGNPIDGTKGYNFIYYASFSPDGKIVASASSDGTIRLWNAETGESIGSPLTGHTSYVESVSFSPDGKLLVSASLDKTVRIWDVNKRTLVKVLQGHTKEVEFASFSPDGQLIASASEDETIRIWDVNTGKQIGEPLKGHNGLVKSVMFSPDGKRLVSASSDKTVRLWDLNNMLETRCFTWNNCYVSSAVFSHDGKSVISSSRTNNDILVWDVATNQICKTLKGHTAQVFHVSISHNGKYLISSSNDNTAKIWDVEKGQLIETIKCQHTSQTSDFSPNDNYVAIGDGNIVRLWDINKGKEIRVLDKRNDLTVYDWLECVRSVSFRPDGKYLATATYRDKTIRIWDVKSGKVIRIFNGHNDAVTSVAFSHDGKYVVSGAYDATIRVWNMKEDNLEERVLNTQRLLDNQKYYINDLSFSHDGKYLLSCAANKSIIVWDFESGLDIQKLEGHTEGVNSASFSSDDKYIVSSSEDCTVRIWEFPPLQQLIDETRERFKGRQLTPEERRKYYLE